ncbi:unnamed protein product [Protopolystoma xenopodis]|uniref:Uncharacterized protein n=1 Tax=Protopolystoma xenopodis TaxID=117903 RepID=A0A3S5CQ80_9PLAT|nr:unnamed protein product [Protopolystoma xenopodis]
MKLTDGSSSEDQFGTSRPAYTNKLGGPWLLSKMGFTRHVECEVEEPREQTMSPDQVRVERVLVRLSRREQIAAQQRPRSLGKEDHSTESTKCRRGVAVATVGDGFSCAAGPGHGLALMVLCTKVGIPLNGGRPNEPSRRTCFYKCQVKSDISNRPLFLSVLATGSSRRSHPPSSGDGNVRHRTVDLVPSRQSTCGHDRAAKMGSCQLGTSSVPSRAHTHTE